MIKTELKIDFCSYEAAKFAVMNWHYSKSMPMPPIVKYGIWENDKFIGVIIFGMGAAKDLGGPIGLKMFEYCELVRVALTIHKNTVTKIISIAIKLLKMQSPKLKVIISFADPEHNHFLPGCPQPVVRPHRWQHTWYRELQVRGRCLFHKR